MPCCGLQLLPLVYRVFLLYTRGLSLCCRPCEHTEHPPACPLSYHRPLQVTLRCAAIPVAALCILSLDLPLTFRAVLTPFRRFGSTTNHCNSRRNRGTDKGDLSKQKDWHTDSQKPHCFVVASEPCHFVADGVGVGEDLEVSWGEERQEI